jgi:hypothetical protein
MGRNPKKTQSAELQNLCRLLFKKQGAEHRNLQINHTNVIGAPHLIVPSGSIQFPKSHIKHIHLSIVPLKP